MNSVKNYCVVTAAYWGFTLTDGALRMLVLLHFYQSGFTPIEVSILFLLYELLGVITNLFGGWVAVRFGVRLTLFTGLALQVLALLMLGFLDSAWDKNMSILYVLMSQGLSGVAKDLTKLSAKSAIKGLVPENKTSTLFRWVAALTGSKNTLKGLGFFAGGALLSFLGFEGAVFSMGLGLMALLMLLFLLFEAKHDVLRTKVPIKGILSKSRKINVISMARFFLFGGRDVWFVVGVPLFLTDALGWSFVGIGTFMAAWVMLYGLVQMFAPAIVTRSEDGESSEIRFTEINTWLLALIPLGISLLLVMVQGIGSLEDTIFSYSLITIAGLGLFCVVFAVNSSVHSYLIVVFSNARNASADVGFYYMANAGGRFVGTILSGLLYEGGGLVFCLIGSAAMIALSACAFSFMKMREKEC